MVFYRLCPGAATTHLFHKSSFAERWDLYLNGPGLGLAKCDPTVESDYIDPQDSYHDLLILVILQLCGHVKHANSGLAWFAPFPPVGPYLSYFKIPLPNPPPKKKQKTTFVLCALHYLSSELSWDMLKASLLLICCLYCITDQIG